jgi:hypothetical protein
METELTFSELPNIEFATNTFINVPVILRYEDIDLITLVKQALTEYRTKIPIYHSDGTKLATAINSRIYLEKDIKDDIKIEKHPYVWVCKRNGREIFEIRQAKDLYKLYAELYTNDGYFIKYSNYGHDVPMKNITDLRRCASNCVIRDVEIGFWVKCNGSVTIGYDSRINKMRSKEAAI